MSPAPVSVIIPTWDRLDDLQQTLSVIKSCDPAPEEIIVHVDAGDTDTAPWLNTHYPNINILQSQMRQGPGGGRNRLLNKVESVYIVSLDDDSYPIDRDYFQRVVAAFERHPQAGILAASICHRGESMPKALQKSRKAASFVGCGCAYRKSAWLDVDGYVPLPRAYGMEETDVSLQMIDAGWTIVHDHRLRILHDTDLKHHDSPAMTAAALANRALLAYLRYPASHWWLGVLQYMNRIRWSIRNGRREGLLRGIRETLPLLWKHRNERDPVSVQALQTYRSLQDS